MHRWTMLRLGAIAVCLAQAAGAEVLKLTGSLEGKLTEIRGGLEGDVIEVREHFPETSSALPIQIFGHLLSKAPEAAAGAFAAQLADPATGGQTNPEEFSAHLALATSTSAAFHRARLLLEERRQVVFTEEELGVSGGDTVEISGTFFLDGAVVLFAGEDEADLGTLGATIEIHVFQRDPSAPASEPGQLVLQASIGLAGGPSGQVEVTRGGALASAPLQAVDLRVLFPEFSIFDVVRLSEIELDYEYEVAADQEVELVARMTVTGASIPGESGVAVLLGSDLDVLDEVLDQVLVESQTAKMLSAIERSASGSPPAGASVRSLDEPVGLFPPLSCGLLGPTAFGLLATPWIATVHRRRLAKSAIGA